eukprot:scaffold672_cov268-Pinguiococcus_pyrenoidosus.AAC.15
MSEYRTSLPREKDASESATAPAPADSNSPRPTCRLGRSAEEEENGLTCHRWSLSWHQEPLSPDPLASPTIEAPVELSCRRSPLPRPSQPSSPRGHARAAARSLSCIRRSVATRVPMQPTQLARSSPSAGMWSRRKRRKSSGMISTFNCSVHLPGSRPSGAAERRRRLRTDSGTFTVKESQLSAMYALSEISPGRAGSSKAERTPIPYP